MHTFERRSLSDLLHFAHGTHERLHVVAVLEVVRVDEGVHFGVGRGQRQRAHRARVQTHTQERERRRT